MESPLIKYSAFAWWDHTHHKYYSIVFCRTWDCWFGTATVSSHPFTTPDKRKSSNHMILLPDGLNPSLSLKALGLLSPPQMRCCQCPAPIHFGNVENAGDRRLWWVRLNTQTQGGSGIWGRIFFCQGLFCLTSFPNKEIITLLPFREESWKMYSHHKPISEH